PKEAGSDDRFEVRTQQLLRLRNPAQRAAPLDANPASNFVGCGNKSSPNAFASGSNLRLTVLLLQGAPSIYLRVLGNKDFSSEQLLGTEVGYRTLVAEKLYVDFAVFQNQYND